MRSKICVLASPGESRVCDARSGRDDAPTDEYVIMSVYLKTARGKYPQDFTKLYPSSLSIVSFAALASAASLRREICGEEPPVHRSSSAQLDPIPNCLIFASARQDN